MDAGLSGYPHQYDRHKLDKILSRWAEVQRNTIYLLIKKYGLPNEANKSRIIWYRNGPWKRTIVYRDTVRHNFPTPHPDYLANTIDYKVPLPCFDELAHFDGSLYIDRTAGEATAKCDHEQTNLMALNLMHDIVTGKRNVEDARRFAVETAEAFLSKGQSSPYIERLLFPKQSHTADPDKGYF